MKKALLFMLVSFVTAVLMSYGCGRAGGPGEEWSGPTSRVSIEITGDASNSVLEGGILHSLNYRDAGSEASGYGDGADGISSINDTADATCRFIIGANVTSPSGYIPIRPTAGECGTTYSANKCITCITDYNDTALPRTCSISCNGTVPSNPQTAGELINLAYKINGSFTSDMPDPIAGAIRFDGELVSGSGTWHFDPQSDFSIDESLCSGTNSSEPMDVSNTDPLGIGNYTASEWHDSWEILDLNNGSCTISMTMGDAISLSGLETPGSVLDVTGGSIDASILICDDSGNCGATSATYWSRTYGGSQFEINYASCSHETSDGGIIVAGDTTSFGESSGDVFVMKLNADGSVVWQKAYGTTDTDVALSIQETSDGGFIVAGYNLIAFGDGLVIKLDSTGSVVWAKIYGGTGFENLSSAIQTSDGGYIAVGYTTSYGAGNADVWVLKLDEDGNVEWAKTYGGTMQDFASSVRQTSDGGYIIAASTGSFSGTDDGWVLKLNSDGTLAWEKRYGGAGDDYLLFAEEDSDNYYIVAGYSDSFGTGDEDLWVLKLHSASTGTAGDIVWQKRYGETAYDEQAVIIREISDSSYVVAGYSQAADASGWMAGLNSTDGSALWAREYDSTGDDQIASVGETSGGGFLLSGYTNSFGAGNDDFWVLMTDSSGDISSCGIITTIPSITENTTSVTPQDSTESYNTTAPEIVSDAGLNETAGSASIDTQCTEW